MKKGLFKMLTTGKLEKDSDQFQYTLATYGLNLSSKTGGAHYSGLENAKLTSADRDQIALIVEDEDPIIFYDSEKFMKTIQRTESSLRIRLFN